MHVYILLDRSGSMALRWGEAISSINAYVKELTAAKATAKAKVTLAVFDHHAGLQYDVIRNAVSASDWPMVTETEVTPRGSTPLYDAIGRIIGAAEADKPKKAIIVIMTDGYENTSREMTKETAKAALDRVREKNYGVIFLGADFDAMGQAMSLGTAPANTLNTKSGKMGDAMRVVASVTQSYASGVGGQSIRAFDDSDRKKALDD